MLYTKYHYIENERYLVRIPIIPANGIGSILMKITNGVINGHMLMALMSYLNVIYLIRPCRLC